MSESQAYKGALEYLRSRGYKVGDKPERALNDKVKRTAVDGQLLTYRELYSLVAVLKSKARESSKRY